MTDPLLQQTFKGVFRLAAPEIALIGTACLVFLFGCLYNRRWLWFVVSLLGVALAMILAGTVKTQIPDAIGAASLVPDSTAAFVRWVALIAAAVLLFVSWAEVDHTNAAEYYACLLVAAAGASLVGRANDLVTLFLALELLSIPTYILLYLPARTKPNQEAAAKYFLLSVMSSGLMLFGFSYLYGLTGSTNLTVIADTLTKGQTEAVNPMALLAAVLVIAGLGFRIAAVPFHFYAPDVYEGGPAGVVAQLAFFPKLAGFVALARVFGLVGVDTRHIPFDADTQVPLLLWIIAIATMCLGNVLALLQDNVRRMLAYSSIAHGGYMLIGVVVASSLPDAKGTPGVGGIDAVLVYLVAYGMMTIGAFAVILYLSTPERPVESIDDLAGLGQSHPVSAGAMAVFLFSLIGLPLTAGFAGKLLLFVGVFTAPSDTPAMRNLYQLMALFAAINAAVGAYYYLRIVGVMYLRTPIRPATSSGAVPTLLAAVALAGATLFFGIYPEPIARAARKAAPVFGSASTKGPLTAKLFVERGENPLGNNYAICELKNNTDEPIELRSQSSELLAAFVDIEVLDSAHKRISQEFYRRGLGLPTGREPQLLATIAPGKSIKMRVGSLFDGIDADTLKPGEYHCTIRFKYDDLVAASEPIAVELTAANLKR